MEWGRRLGKQELAISTFSSGTTTNGSPSHAMEAVGYTAAALSLAKATKTTYRLTKLLYRAVRDAGALSQQIEDTTVPFSTFASALEAAMASLKHCCMDDEKNSLVMKYFDKTSFPAHLQQLSRNINTRIRSLYDRIDSIGLTGRLPFGLSDVVKSFK
ncbi:hypothetical protein B0T18DRAFT_387481 [Schizothecium vesticola]|uniref:Uncharacterized protein n=1 Tax=Schizothecium vesticola TaxID=314040 RepID=A0AA40F5G8_9PEZI|nr:hypothetical protein B0T18DRAFT_387481 [Schizothecium vesticola]